MLENEVDITKNKGIVPCHLNGKLPRVKPLSDMDIKILNGLEQEPMVKENDAKGLCFSDKELIGRLQSLVQESRDQKNLRVVLLASGGHFFGFVFDGNNIVAHKTYL